MRDAERHWRAPHGAAWVQGYRDSITAATRPWFRQALAAAGPFETVVDLGCHCGVLMPLILDANPQARVVGIDVSPEALSAAKRAYPDQTWVLASIVDWLPMLVDIGSKADVVMSSSCLEHIAPPDLMATLKAMTQIATSALVLHEVTPTPSMDEGISTTIGVMEWRHDYFTRLATLGWTCRYRTWHDVTSGRPGAMMVFKPKEM